MKSSFRNGGAIAGMIALPALVYYLWLSFSAAGGWVFISWGAAPGILVRQAVPNVGSIAVYGGWLLWQILLYVCLPGRTAAGQPLSDGSRLKYRLNGSLAFWITVPLAALAAWLAPRFVYDNLGRLLTMASLVALLSSAYLFVRGRGRGAQQFFAGVERNPRIGRFDLKFFCEGRPGLIGWAVIDIALAFRQGPPSTALLLVLACQLLYVADYFWHEEAILSTYDIVHERFGFMLAWGDLVWVPFVYSLQVYFLASHPQQLPAWAVAAIATLDLAGYALFRVANLQKHHFRSDPARPIWGKRPAFIRTTNGSLLLTSGLWGLARHMNYTGDLLMALAWSLPTLFVSPLTYVYPAFLVVLLVQRERRDHARCLAKYGEAWQAYCRQVRWRLVPGLY